MKITPTDYKNLAKFYNDTTKIAAKNQESPASGNVAKSLKGSEYDVKISSDYKLHKKAMQELLETECRDDKVKSIAIKIDSGTYKIEPSKIAQSIVDKL